MNLSWCTGSPTETKEGICFRSVIVYMTLIPQRKKARKIVFYYLFAFFFCKKYDETYTVSWERENDILYLARNFLSLEWNIQEEADWEYISVMLWSFEEHIEAFVAAVAPHIKTFTLEEMDITDKTLLFLLYLEFHIVWSDKKLAINEAINLWKEFGDRSSYKLINAVWNAIVS